MQNLIRMILCSLLISVSAFAQDAAKWTETDGTNALTGDSFARFVLSGKYLTPPRVVPSEAPSLVVVCNEEKVGQSYIAVGAAVARSANTGGSSPVPISLDATIDGNKTTIRANGLSTDGLAVNLARGDLMNLLASHVAVIGTHENNGAEIVMQFDMPDPSAVLAGCSKDSVLNHKN